VLLIGLAIGAGLFLIAVPIMFWQQRRWRAGCRAGAAKIFREMSETYRGEHVYRTVTPAEFPRVDPTGYREVGDALMARGFRHVATYENVTVNQVYPDNRTFMEGYIREDGLVDVTSYRLLDAQTVDVASYLEDGRFVVTTNADLDKLAPPPNVLKDIFPRTTSVEFLLTRHAARMAELTAAEPQARFVSLKTFEEALDVLRRHSRAVSEFRQKLGLITEEEMVAMASRMDQEPTARQIWKEIQLLRERAAAS
jgi:hypothetical protein